ncbi:peptidylprolyl isomerase [Virgibacillus profundi]|uniref:Peptidyl-prolyl cis-trans isomerase n=1 Tax=Virgibacillus profundi TaxID=2024555 RepID=A0A2A2ICF6_9BACI|nr:peptidylprolyl isomerase [Virgibacillus profundi]PAV29419.1 peptidylprolyl isomerase [Virgibacillus profundi]PXY53589.1 peptidylprolyl isomerase [Virgibacillus profundi]
MKFSLRNTTFLLTAILMVIFLAGCGTESESEENQSEESTDEQAQYPSEVEENPIVTITMENDEEITIELFPEIAPNTVANFISLVEEGFYDGLIFHRVIPGFMIQGGDPSGNGTGGPDYAIKGEFSSNGFENDLKHDRGVLSMARSQSPDSAGSQFFIMTENSPHLDGEYAGFGQVIKGMETVDAIVSAERDAADKPLEDQKMKTVEVDTKGFDYPEPEVE